MKQRYSLILAGACALVGCGGPTTVHSVSKPPIRFSQPQAHALVPDEPKAVVKTLFPFLTIDGSDGQTVIPATQGGVYVINWKSACHTDSGADKHCADDTIDNVTYYHA